MKVAGRGSAWSASQQMQEMLCVINLMRPSYKKPPRMQWGLRSTLPWIKKKRHIPQLMAFTPCSILIWLCSRIQIVITDSYICLPAKLPHVPFQGILIIDLDQNPLWQTGIHKVMLKQCLTSIHTGYGNTNGSLKYSSRFYFVIMVRWDNLGEAIHWEFGFLQSNFCVHTLAKRICDRYLDNRHIVSS